jgi:hypothetical protein
MKNEIKVIRRWLIFFMIALFLSGLTAMPLESELGWLRGVLPANTLLNDWINRVYLALSETNSKYPFIAYGADWLAFAHFILALLFIGPYKDPIRNKWIIEFGMIACLLVIPFAFAAGEMRGIPIWWRMIDCSFGIIGLLPLGYCLKRINRLEELQSQLA